MKLSFKNHKREGKYRSFQKQSADVKGNGLQIGYITEWNDKFVIYLHLKMPSTGEIERFTNVRLKARCDSIADAKQWVKDNWKNIQKYPLHQIEK